MFNPGDKVVCIKRDGWGTEIGEEYTIEEIETNKINTWLRFEEVDWWHCIEYFEKTKEVNEI